MIFGFALYVNHIKRTKFTCLYTREIRSSLVTNKIFKKTVSDVEVYLSTYFVCR